LDTSQQYSAAETERMMKLQDVLFKAMATNLKNGAHVQIERELRSREYDREIILWRRNHDRQPARLGDPHRLDPVRPIGKH
jgi:hypothetical protein